MFLATVLLVALLFVGAIYTKFGRFTAFTPFNKDTTAPLRGLLALLIVAHHLGQRTHVPILSNFSGGIGYQIVAIFFFISGYGLNKSFSRKGASYLDGFLGKRHCRFRGSFM